MENKTTILVGESPKAEEITNLLNEEKAKDIEVKKSDLIEAVPIRNQQQAKWLIKNKLVPSCFQSVNQIVLAIETARALGAKNFGDAYLMFKNMFVVNNSVQLWGELPLAVVKKSGLLEDIDEFFLNDQGQQIRSEFGNIEDTPAASVCLIKRTGEATTKEFILTKKDLELSGGVFNKNGSWEMGGKYKSATWKKYPKIHWIRRNRAFALKSVFPDVLLSIGIGEYDGKSEERKEVSGNILDAYKEK